MFEAWLQGAKRQILAVINAFVFILIFFIFVDICFYRNVFYNFIPDDMSGFVFRAITTYCLFPIAIACVGHRRTIGEFVFFSARFAVALALIGLVMRQIHRLLPQPQNSNLPAIVGVILILLLQEYYKRRPPFPQTGTSAPGSPRLTTGSHLRRRHWR